MPYLEMDQIQSFHCRIMIFTEGTILKPRSFFRLYCHKSYIPIGNCVALLRGWVNQGAEIVYCTSRRNRQAEEIAGLLHRYGFPGTKLYYRARRQTYKALVEAAAPDILIEDDCRSIGGSRQMCVTYLDPQWKENVKSIVVREFKGIDHLPENLLELQFGGPRL